MAFQALNSRQPLSLSFYQFLASQSFLIGLLPFYIPVFLWGEGFSLVHITSLIAISGFSFCIALRLWQRLALRWSLAKLLALSFVLELLVVLLSAGASLGLTVILLLGIANGFYNAFFWTTQRTLFLALLGNNDSGKKYGSFQIFVAAFLKIGILFGGVLLDLGGMSYLLLLSAIVGLGSSIWFYKKIPANEKISAFKTTSFKDSLRYKDKHNSAWVFGIDGLFLFLESHFWTLSLFLLIKQDYSQFGLTVVVLAIIFAVLFFLLKNTIDKLLGTAIYYAAVLLYSLSWVLRVWLGDAMSTPWQLTLLILITFCTSFFRLLFNKRFFDNAQQLDGTTHLIVKSYLSQFWLGCGYLLISMALFWHQTEPLQALDLSYSVAAIITLLYLLYRPVSPSTK